MKLAVYYSLSFDDMNFRVCGLYMQQLLTSLTSLRKNAPDIPIYLKIYGELSSSLEAILNDLNVQTKVFSSYQEELEHILPHEGAAILAKYPRFHKWMNLDFLYEVDTEYILYVDSDTYFYSSPISLCSNMMEHDFMSALSGVLKDKNGPFQQKQSLLEHIQLCCGENYPPINSGVMLFRPDLFKSVENHLHDFLLKALGYFKDQYVRKLMDKQHPVGKVIENQLHYMNSVTQDKWPLGNLWVVEETAAMSLLKKANAQIGIFDTAIVASSNHEGLFANPSKEPIIHHYFSAHQEQFFAKNKIS